MQFTLRRTSQWYSPCFELILSYIFAFISVVLSINDKNNVGWMKKCQNRIWDRNRVSTILSNRFLFLMIILSNSTIPQLQLEPKIFSIKTTSDSPIMLRIFLGIGVSITIKRKFTTFALIYLLLKQLINSFLFPITQFM